MKSAEQAQEQLFDEIDRDIEKERLRQKRIRESASNNISRYSIADFYNACLGSTDYHTNCFNVENHDLKKLCLGRSERNDVHCFGIGSEDMKNLCLGISNSKYSSSCYSITNDDLKSTCLAASNLKFHDYCYSIYNSNWKIFCGGLAINSNNCYNLN